MITVHAPRMSSKMEADIQLCHVVICVSTCISPREYRSHSFTVGKISHFIPDERGGGYVPLIKWTIRSVYVRSVVTAQIVRYSNSSRKAFALQSGSLPTMDVTIILVPIPFLWTVMTRIIK